MNETLDFWAETTHLLLALITHTSLFLFKVERGPRSELCGSDYEVRLLPPTTSRIGGPKIQNAHHEKGPKSLWL